MKNETKKYSSEFKQLFITTIPNSEKYMQLLEEGRYDIGATIQEVKEKIEKKEIQIDLRIALNVGRLSEMFKQHWEVSIGPYYNE